MSNTSKQPAKLTEEKVLERENNPKPSTKKKMGSAKRLPPKHTKASKMREERIQRNKEAQAARRQVGCVVVSCIQPMVPEIQISISPFVDAGGVYGYEELDRISALEVNSTLVRSEL